QPPLFRAGLPRGTSRICGHRILPAEAYSASRAAASRLPTSALLLAAAPALHHEADVGVAGQRRSLEYALHDHGFHFPVDLEHRDAVELLARVDLLEHLSPPLQQI